MNNKKIIISIILVILVIVAIGFGIFKATHNENYLYNQDGTITDGKSELINHLKSIEDTNESDINVQEKININTATKDELTSLNGIGEATANKIINYRNIKCFRL